MTTTDCSTTGPAAKPAIKGRGQDSSFKSDSITSGAVRRVQSGLRVGGGQGRVGRVEKRVRSGASNSQKIEFSKNFPAGKWRRDKFAENENGVAPAPLGAIAGANKKVRLSVANLAPTVSREDLQELFASFSVSSLVVHYDENGTHLGTGNVEMKRGEAEKAMKEFRGISIDGSRLMLSIVDGSTTSVRPISERITRMKKVASVGGGRVQKRSVATNDHSLRRVGTTTKFGRNSLKRNNQNAKIKEGRVGGGRKEKKEKKPQSETELDAELESYMKRSEVMEA
ncbi:hypothetical protein PFISCL1PPCAC_11167 [Pristionchus fissidentatus]|uniref:RRM domain-containing protein n=1 Tax=Pristionchus fissidentatus TaxID=1538716 RepID=A0AAV5VMG4_9BILA|nr:hypothetical protein PFISCL1PPCAC_11167 [Pristionchus fissidentatus]